MGYSKILINQPSVRGSEDNSKGHFDGLGVNSKKLGPTLVNRNKNLRRLLRAVDGIRLRSDDNTQVDTSGNAYEFPMDAYSSRTVESGAELFTLQAVSELLAKTALVGNIRVNKMQEKEDFFGTRRDAGRSMTDSLI